MKRLQPLFNAHTLSVVIVMGGGMASAGLAAVANWIAANGLGVAGFGMFSIAIALMTVLQEIGGPALDTAIVRFVASSKISDRQRAELYHRAGMHIKFAVSSLFAIGLILGADYLSESVFKNMDLKPLFNWMAVCIIAANISTSILARLQGLERFVTYAMMRILVNGIKVLILAGLFLLGWLNPQSAAAGWTLSFLITYLIGVFLCRTWEIGVRKEVGDHPYRDIIRFGGWTMLAGLLFAIHMRTDILLLGYFGSDTDVGHYAVAWNLMLLIDLISASLVAAMLPKAAKAKSAKEVSALRKQSMMIGLVISLLLLPIYIFIEPIMALFFPGFEQSVMPFRILFWSSILVLLIYPLYLGFYAQNRPHKLTNVYGLLTLAGIVSGFILIPTYGLVGAAVTTLVARAVGAAAILLIVAAEQNSTLEELNTHA